MKTLLITAAFICFTSIGFAQTAVSTEAAVTTNEAVTSSTLATNSKAKACCSGSESKSCCSKGAGKSCHGGEKMHDDKATNRSNRQSGQAEGAKGKTE